VAITLAALFAMAVWIEYEELYNFLGGPLAQNAPPNSAVGVICGVILLGALLYRFRRTFRLCAAELVVIYAALTLAAPLMTQGFCQRIVGMVISIPHNQDFKSYESLPPMLWPHGPNLCTNGRFVRGLEGFVHTGGGTVGWRRVDRGRKGVWDCPVLDNAGDTNNACTLSFAMARHDAQGRDRLPPGDRYLLALLVKTEGFAKGSSYTVNLQADDRAPVTVLSGAMETRPSYASPEGFLRAGASPVPVPEGLSRQLSLQVVLNGPGRLIVQDVQFMNVQAVEGLFSGRAVVREKDLAALEPDERAFLSVRPDRLCSLAGVRFLLQGYVPWSQWAQPALAWGLLVAAMFAAFLGLNVLMRRQWAEHERFTFPLTIIPQQLFAEEDGRIALFRNRVMWLGFGLTLVLAVAEGVRFYVPNFPSVVPRIVGLGTYVDSPVLKAFLQNVSIGGQSTGIGFSFCLLAVALLVETDVLFSLWSMFLLFQLWSLCGKVFNGGRYPGYPWEFQQAMGAFIAYALLAVFVGRQHLGRVLRSVVGRGETPEPFREMMSYRRALLLVAGALVALAGWGLWTGIGVRAALFFFGYILVCGFAASKIRAEMGAPFGYFTPIYGLQFVAAIGGYALFHSTALLVISIAAGFMCTACFLYIAPVQVEMMELGRQFRVRPADIGAGLTLGLAGGLVIGGFVLLCWAYGFGVDNLRNTSPYEQNWYFGDHRTREASLDRAVQGGTLGRSPETAPLDVVHNPDARGLGIGAGITAVLAVLRAKLPWFPFHPLGYVLASSHFMRTCWFLFFLAWAARLVLFRVGGAHMIRRGLVPFCAGMFLACIATIVIFDFVGICLRMQGVVDVYSRIP
jgi:hypothetical protein